MVLSSFLIVLSNLLVISFGFPQNDDYLQKKAVEAALLPEEGELAVEDLEYKWRVVAVTQGDCESNTPAAVGDTLAVLYDGRVLNTTEEFASRWDADDPFVFKLGEGKVVKGWEIGLPGMCVGEKRIFTLPPEMGYGEEGLPPSIPPNSALQYTVLLIGKQTPESIKRLVLYK